MSWTILQFIRPETYYVQYGTDETLHDMMSVSVMSSMDASLLNQTYSISLENLNPGTLYYLRVVAVFNYTFIIYSDIISFWTYDQGCLIECYETFET